MATATKTIDREVMEQIDAGTWKDGGFIMPQMDPKLYQKVKKVLLALGGKWNRSAQATLFDEDGEASIREASDTGTYIDLKKAYQSFYTPPEVTWQLLEISGYDWEDPDCLKGVQAFEPQAGDGNIAAMLVEHGAEVWAHEIREECRAKLEAIGCHTTIGDFLEVADSKDYDLVIQNPPFSGSQDIAHFMYAYKFVKPGGILVSVMSPGFTFRSDKKAVNFREWLADGDGEWEWLPDRSFSASGTDVRTVVASMRRPK